MRTSDLVMTEIDPPLATGHFHSDHALVRRPEVDGDLVDVDHAEDVVAHLEEDDEEWLGGLRRVGLPIRQRAGERDAPSAGLRHLLEEAQPMASVGLRELVANSVAEGTRAAYEKDWRDFATFCRAHRLCDDPLDASALVVGEYVNELVRDRKAYSTITRRVAAISYCQRLATGSTVARDPLVTAALQGARRLLTGRGQKQAAPLRLAEMRSITTALPILAAGRPTMRRDQLLVALGWASALRASELVGLDVEDLTVVGDPNSGDGGLVIRVRNGKGADGVEWVAVPFSSQIHTCPVRRTIAFTASIRSGPVFRHIDRRGRPHRRLAARPVSDIVRRAITEALQYDPAGYSSHSLRAGFVTEARARGVPDALTARHTRHARPGRRAGGILNVYDRPTDLFERSALDPTWW